MFGEKKPETADDQTQEEKDLASYVRNKLEESRSNANRIASEGLWLTNVAYVMGFDSITFNTATRQFVPLNTATPYLTKNRVTWNKILPKVQNRLARLCKVPPRFDTIPDSASEEDKDAALLGLDILTDIWQREEINRKRIPMMMWMQQCGHAYLKVTWDGESGKEMMNPETGEIGREGRCRIDVVSAFEVFPDPLAKELDEDDCARLIHAKVRKLDYFQNTYDRGYMVKAEGNWLQSLQYEARVNTMSVNSPGGSASDEQGNHDSAIEMSLYEKPGKKHRKGRHIVVANGVLLKDGELPVGMYPFAKFDDVVIGGKYNSEACVTHARPLQDQWNATVARRGEWVRKMLAGKYIAAKGHGLAKEALNDRNGEVVEYNPVPMAGPPQAMDIPQIPQYAYQETVEIESGMSDIFGLSEVAQGRLPSAGIPAKGMELLLEADETRAGIEIEQHEHAYARLGTLILKHIEAFAKTKRSIQKRQAQGGFQIKEYTGKDLRGNTAVMVVRGSTVPTSKAMRRQEIFNAYQQGLLGDPADPAVRQKVMQLTEFGDVAGMWKSYASDMQQIKRTVEDIETGVVVPNDMAQGPVPQGVSAIQSASEYDNHILYIQELNEYRKSDKYDLLDETQKKALLEVMDAHLEWQTRLSNPQVAMPPKAPMNLEDPIAGAEAELEGGDEPVAQLETEEGMIG